MVWGKTFSVWQTKIPWWWAWSEENGQTGWSWQLGYSNPNSYFLQSWWAEKHLIIHNLEADRVQQKTRSGSSPVNQKQCEMCLSFDLTVCLWILIQKITHGLILGKIPLWFCSRIKFSYNMKLVTTHFPDFCCNSQYYLN